MDAKSILDTLLQRRKDLGDEMRSLDQQIEATKKEVVAAFPSGYAAIWSEGDFHVVPVATVGMEGPDGLFLQVCGEDLEVSWDPGFGDISNRTINKGAEIQGTEMKGFLTGYYPARLGFFSSKEDAESAVSRWKAEEKSEAD